MSSRFSISVGLLATMLLGACDWMPGKPVKEDETPVPADVHSFNVLYRDTCSGCHGADGQFGGARPLNDPLYLSLASDEYMLGVMTDGVPHTLMPPFAISKGGSLTNSQLRDILQGIRRSWGPMPDTPGVTPPSLSSATKGEASRGRTLFASHCAACHGDDGRGGKVAGNVIDPSYLALVSDQSLRSNIICGRLDLGMPDWNGAINGVVAEQRKGLAPLNDKDVSDLVAFLASHRVEFPGAPFPSLENPRDTD